MTRQHYVCCGLPLCINATLIPCAGHGYDVRDVCVSSDNSKCAVINMLSYSRATHTYHGLTATGDGRSRL